MSRKILMFTGLFSISLVLATMIPLNLPLSASTPTKAQTSVVAKNQRVSKSDLQQINKAILQDNQPISPQAPVTVRKVAVVSPYALAIVLIGEHGGGMSALMKKQGVWQVIGGGGGAIDEKYLVELGVPPKIANQLMRQI